MALLLTPSLSTWLDATETQTHWLLFGLALPISGVALYRGYRREPRTMTLAMGLTGLLLMFVGVVHLFGEELEITLTTVGVILVMLAHIRNLHAGHNHAGEEARP